MALLAPATGTPQGNPNGPWENYSFCREKLGLNPVGTLPPPEEAEPGSDEPTTVGGELVD